MAKKKVETSGFWGGCYTADADGNGIGVTRLSEASDGTVVAADAAATTDSPSYLVQHPTKPVLYAVGEIAQTVRAYTIDGDNLTPLGDVEEAGELVCHLSIDPSGRYLVAACWGDGQVVCYDLDKKTGAIAGRTVAAPAKDPYNIAGRPTRAHASLTLPDGRIMTTDLGYDLVRVWEYKRGKGLIVDHTVTMPKGSGPRHLVWHPSGHVYVNTEVSCEVIVLKPDTKGRFAVASVTPICSNGAAKDDAAAHISLDETGEHVHVTVRGSNRIAVLAVRNAGVRLEPVTDVDCGGKWPRHHLQYGDRLYVMNQLSDTITTFRLDESGVPAELLHTLETPSPACLVAQHHEPLQRSPFSNPRR